MKRKISLNPDDFFPVLSARTFDPAFEKKIKDKAFFDGDFILYSCLV